MKISKPKAFLKRTFPLFLSLAMVAGLLPVSPQGDMMIKNAEARGAGGFRGGAVGFRGGAVAAYPRSYVYRGTASVTAGPRRAYVEGPRGGEAYVGPRWGAVRGPYGGTMVVRTLPVGARAVAIAGATYYVAGGVYYRPIYSGNTIVYQQVENPEAP